MYAKPLRSMSKRAIGYAEKYMVTIAVESSLTRFNMKADVVEHLGRITGYATGIAWMSHAIGKTNEDLKALIGAAPAFLGPGFLVPTRNGDLMRWCLNNGLRIVVQATLMTIGIYKEPAGAYLPSMLY